MLRDLVRLCEAHPLNKKMPRHVRLGLRGISKIDVVVLRD